MASGTITGSGSYVSLKITWSSTAGTGGSTVNATLTAVNQTHYYYYATVNNGYSLTINGNAASGSTSKLSSTASGSSNLISHSVWVAYTGDKSITISGYANMKNITASGNTIGERSVSGTAKLDKIGSVPSVVSCTAPAAGYVSELGQTVTISWGKTSSYSGSGGYYVDVSVSGGAWTRHATITNINTTSTTYTTYAGQGGTYQFRVLPYNDIGTASSYGYSGVLTRNSLSAPTIGTINTYNPYVTSALSVPLSGGSQANGGSFMRMADLYYGSTWLATCATPSNGNTSASITYAAANYASYLGNAYSSGSFRVVAWIQNSSGSRSSYVEKYFTVNINTDGGATPTISASSISGGALGYGATCFIAGVSELKVTVGNVALRRGGKSYSWSLDVTGYNSAYTSPKTYSNLTAGVKNITVTVTDNRGLSASTTTQIRVQSYASPTITSIKGVRLSSPNTSAQVTYSLSYSPIYAYSAGVNTAGSQLNGINSQQYAVNGGTTFTSCTSGVTITNLAAGSTHTINLRVSDKVRISSYTPASVLIPTITVPFAFRKSGIGINCIPQSGYALDVSGIIRSTSGGNHTLVQGGGIELSHATPFIDFHFGNSSSDYTARIIETSSGALKVYNSIANASDERLKKDFVDIDNKYKDVLTKVKPCMFRYKKGDDYLHVGFKAQDLDRVFNELGIEDKPIISQDNDEYYSLDYSQIASLLWYGWQEQQKEINELKQLVKGGE